MAAKKNISPEKRNAIFRKLSEAVATALDELGFSVSKEAYQKFYISGYVRQEGRDLMLRKTHNFADMLIEMDEPDEPVIKYGEACGKGRS